MAGGRSAGRRRSEPVGPLLHAVLSRLGYHKRASALFAMAVWDRALGEAVARHARPERVERDTLHVVVDGAPWANELRWMESALVAQLNAACGRTVVRRLRFRIGTLPAWGGEGGTRQQAPAPHADEVARAERIARPVADPDLATAFGRLVARALARDAATAGKGDDGA
ncbi:MAG: DUF721 domain-containing protein [Firmicutes bacterium]|nr:DUF721 domain-containing protein [Bacillota bacterium]